MESCLTLLGIISWEQIGSLLIYSLLEIITRYCNENQHLAVKILKGVTGITCLPHLPLT